MPFQPGHKLAPGGAREGSGPKPESLRRELAELFSQHCNLEQRGQIVDMLTTAARCGNVKAATFLFDRYYGKPESTDVAELLSRLQQFMESVVAAITQEVDADTRERILARLNAPALDAGPDYPDPGRGA